MTGSGSSGGGDEAGSRERRREDQRGRSTRKWVTDKGDGEDEYRVNYRGRRETPRETEAGGRERRRRTCRVVRIVRAGRREYKVNDSSAGSRET